MSNVCGLAGDVGDVERRAGPPAPAPDEVEGTREGLARMVWVVEMADSSAADEEVPLWGRGRDGVRSIAVAPVATADGAPSVGGDSVPASPSPVPPPAVPVVPPTSPFRATPEPVTFGRPFHESLGAVGAARSSESGTEGWGRRLGDGSSADVPPLDFDRPFFELELELPMLCRPCRGRRRGSVEGAEVGGARLARGPGLGK